MFSWCFRRRQFIDEEEYRQRPRTRNSVIITVQPQQHAPVYVPMDLPEADGGTHKNLEQMQAECLAAHNAFREKHGSGDLILNKKMNEYAMEWATHLADKNILQHRKNNKYGENLYLAIGAPTKTHMDAVNSWYEEIKNYNFKKPGFSSQTGHFTQLVWKASKELGVGIITRGNRTWVVCNYNPPGNIMGHYMDYVPPLTEDTVAKIVQKMQPRKNMTFQDELTPEKIDEEPKPSTAPESDLKIFSKFELDCLESHNKYRAIHGTRPLKLDWKLCSFAHEWAVQLSKSNVMAHRSNNEYGENIYMAENFDPTAERCVKSWYDEIQYYNFSKPGFSLKTGHFTQLVWNNSLKLGVGISKLNNVTYVVCNYSPPGNVMGQFNTQVPRPGSKPTSANTYSNTSFTTSSSSTEESGMDEKLPKKPFEEMCLDSHNNYRAIHGSPPLTLNKNLSFFAKDWAQVRTKQISYSTTRTTKTVKSNK